MAMTRADIVKEIRSAFETSSRLHDFSRLEASPRFRAAQSRPTGIRLAHVQEAVDNAAIVDRYDRLNLSSYVVLARAERPMPHTILALMHQYKQDGPTVVDEAWRVHGPAPQDPTAALADMIARYGVQVRAGEHTGLFIAHVTLPSGTPVGFEEPIRPRARSMSCYIRSAGGRDEVSWLFALRDDEVVREEERALRRAKTMPAELVPLDLWLIRPIDTALMVRGGTMQVTDLVRAAETSLAKSGYAALSIFGGEFEDVDHLTTAVPLPHGKLRATTAGTLRDAGLELRRVGPPFHYDLVVPDCAIDTLTAVAALFSPPQPNPHPRSAVP